MKNKHYCNRVILCLVCCIALLSSAIFQPAFADSKKVMRVGWFIQNGYQEMSKAGNPYGFNYEYLTQIAEYTDWEYKFVEVNSFAECYDMLKTGKIDMMGYLLYSDQRAKEVAFPEQSCGYVTTSIYANKDSKVQPYDFEGFDGMKIACMESNNPIYLREYAKENNFSMELVYYQNKFAIEEAVKTGQVDAGLTAGYQATDTTKILASFAPKPFYFALKKSDEDGLLQLNNALNSLRIEKPFFDRDLSYKYLPQFREELNLTQEEEKYIEENPVIDVAYYSKWVPISVKNQKTGEFTGVAADVFKQISHMTGLKFNYTPVVHSTKEAKDADILASTVYNFSDAYKPGYRLTNSYLNVPLVVIKKSSLKNQVAKSTAVPKQLEDMFECKTIENTRIIEADTIEECLDLVLANEADQALINAFASESFLRNARYKQLQSSLLYNESYGVCIAVKDTENPLLNSIFNKALGIMTISDINAIVYNNTSQENEVSIKTIIDQMPQDIILLAIGAMLLIMILLAAILIRQVKSSRCIKKLLYTDELTGALSYKGLLLQAPNVIKHANKKAFIVDFDINHFGDYNNINGYNKGNELLCMIAAVSLKNGDPSDLCARVQADHFISLALSDSIEEIKERTSLRLNSFREMCGSKSLLISYGIYEITDASLDITTMCDRALVAKRTVKGNYEHYVAVYDEKLHKRQLGDADLLARFENALQIEEFVHYFQPKYDSKTQKIVGAEALVRWVHKTGEIIMPGRFIELFEINGLIRKLDMYMFEQLCKNIRNAIAQKKVLVPISINFSRVNLLNNDFTNNLKEMIEKYQVPAELIEIELTETVFTNNNKVTVENIEELHRIGFLVSMDDFGSGFSSLNMLKDANFDIIKLDRSFLNEVGQTIKGEKIIANIIALAHDLQLEIIAEGVETKEQYEMLKSYGCDMIQGFYFSTPLPEYEFERVVAKINAV